METFWSCSRCDRTQLIVWFISERVPRGFWGCRSGSGRNEESIRKTILSELIHLLTRFWNVARHSHVQQQSLRWLEQRHFFQNLNNLLFRFVSKREKSGKCPWIIHEWIQHVSITSHSFANRMNFDNRFISRSIFHLKAIDRHSPKWICIE